MSELLEVPEVPSFAKTLLEAVLTSPATLAKLSARGMFVSIPLGIPGDVHNANYKIYFNGLLTKRSVLECYAPGDDSGWAVVYKEAVDGMHTGEIELIWGQWELTRGEADYSRKAQKKNLFADVGFDSGLLGFKATPGEKVVIGEEDVGAFDIEAIIAEVSEACSLGPDEVNASDLLEVMTVAEIPKALDAVATPALPDVPAAPGLPNIPGLISVRTDAKAPETADQWEARKIQKDRDKEKVEAERISVIKTMVKDAEENAAHAAYAEEFDKDANPEEMDLADLDGLDMTERSDAYGEA